MPSDYKNTTDTTAATHQAAPDAGQKICVKSWRVSNKSQSETAACLLISGSETIDELVLPPESSKTVRYGVDQRPNDGSSRARGLECNDAEALKFQQTNASLTAGVSSTVVFSVEPV